MNPLKIVLLPGLDGSGKMFQPLLPYLVPDFDPHVVAYPRAGSQSYASLLPFVRAELPQNEAFVLLAESFSGPLALQIAAERPPHLKGLILCASFLASPRAVPRFARRTVAWLAFNLPLFNFVLKHLLLGYDVDPNLVSLMKASLAETKVETLALRRFLTSIVHSCSTKFPFQYFTSTLRAIG